MNRTARRRGKDVPVREILLRALKGMLAGVIFTVAAVLIFGLIVKGSNPADGVISTVNQIIKIAAVILCAFVATRKNAPKKWITGGASGLMYAIVCYFVFSAVNGQMGPVIQLISDAVMAALIGVVCGITFELLRRK